MKTLATIFALLISFSFVNGQTSVSHVETGDSTYTISINNIAPKYILSAMKREVSKKNLQESSIVFGGLEVSLEETEKVYTSKSGKELTKTTSVYRLEGQSYTRLGDLKKALPKVSKGVYLIKGNTYNFDNNTMTLENQSYKNLVYAYMNTLNVRISKNTPNASQTITILENVFKITAYYVDITYTNETNPSDTITRKEKRYSVNGIEYSKISEVKNHIKTAMELNK